MCKKMSQKLDRGFACVSFWPLTAWCGGFLDGFLFLENSGSKSAIFQVVSPRPGRPAGPRENLKDLYVEVLDLGNSNLRLQLQKYFVFGDQ